jgi:hypothetical protein
LAATPPAIALTAQINTAPAAAKIKLTGSAMKRSSVVSFAAWHATAHIPALRAAQTAFSGQEASIEPERQLTSGPSSSGGVFFGWIERRTNRVTR